MFRKPSIPSWSIRSRQILLLLTIFLPALGIVIAAGLLERQDEIGKAGDMALLLSQSLAAQQEQMAASTHEMFATLVQMPAVQQLNAKACNELFIELNRRNPRYSSISLVTPDGNLFASSIPFAAGSINLAERDHIREAVTTLDFSAGEYYVGRPGRLQSIDYALPVLDAEWKTIAVITAAVKIDEIAHFLSRVNLSENCSIVVADRRGVSLLRVSDHKTVPAGRLIPPDFLEKVPEMAEKGVFEQVDEDGVRRIYAYKGVRLKGDAPAYLHFGVGISKEWALRAANAQMRNNLLILFFAALIGTGLSWVFSTLLITRPILRLVATSDVFGKGDVSSRTGLPYADNEFGKLAKAFDDMAALLELREKERDRAEDALREANADLETRVLERTLALSDINATLKSEIEERRRAESALQAEAILRRTLMNQLRDGIVIMDQDGKVFEANRAFSAMLGYSAEEIGYLHVWDWDARMSRESLEEAIRLIDSAGDHFVTRHRRKDGSMLDVEITSTATVHEGRKLIFCACRDISDRVKAEEDLRESESRLKAMFEMASIGVAQADPMTGQWLYVNRKMCEITGYSVEEMLQLRVPEITHPDDREKDWESFQDVVEGRLQSYRMEKRYVRKDGIITWVNVNMTVIRDSMGTPTRTMAAIEDVSERKQAEEESREYEQRLLHAQKAESLGRMAMAIAHNFNNMLGVVMGNLELAREEASQDSDLQVCLDEAMNASERAAKISRFMLAYLGQSTVRTGLLDFAKAIREVCARFNDSIPANVHLKADLPDSGPHIQADGPQLTLILNNLLSNAVEAIGEEEGEIVLKLDVLQGAGLSESKLLPFDFEPKEKEYACLSIVDTGIGISQEDLDNIFDPFFSTKFIGRGLGLPVVSGLLQAIGGAVSVESEPGRGSTFRVFVPLSGQEKVSSPAEYVPVENLAGGGGPVLVVDDEAIFRQMAKPMLKRLMGCDAVIAGDGLEALKIFRMYKNEICLVLLDISMPGMDGWQTLSALRAIRPDIPVILSSGFDEVQVSWEDHPERERPNAFLPKPYGMRDLKAALETALNVRFEENGADVI